MASSSSSLSPRYDVFLSFRGQDSRTRFTRFLLKALRSKKIQTFFDDDELPRGEEISPALIKAIEGSKISLIIFTENYADSKWCLDELVKILECRQTLNQIVIPVFYDHAQPTNVRNQTGKFGSSFDRLPNIYESKKEEWRIALKRAGKLSGWESISFRGDDILVDTIVDEVLKVLKNGSDIDCAPEGLIGTKSRIDNIMRLLRIEESPNDFRIVGIWGMAGAGKTTIAEEVFKHLSGRFESYYFLENVREKTKKEDLDSMRGNLVSNLLNDDILNKPTPHIGDSFTNDRLRRTKVLVVLDDVDDSSYLEKLIGKRGGRQQFGRGSRVIVTTRDRQVLEAHDIKNVYEMELLDDRDALELLSYHALYPEDPIMPYPEISNRMVEYAKGVPLVLRELGLSLRGKVQRQLWEGALIKLKKVPLPQITNVFKTSYDSLDVESKEIFLDIACFFKGISNKTVQNVLAGCYYAVPLGIDDLILKSLIYISPITKSIRDTTAKVGADAVEMHDLVQVIGLNIAITESEKAGSRSRLWRQEDVSYVLRSNTGTGKIRCINFDMSEVKVNGLTPETFAKMDNLKFLRIIDSNSSYSPSDNSVIRRSSGIAKILGMFYSNSSRSPPGNSKIRVPKSFKTLPDGLKYFDCHTHRLHGLSSFNKLVEVHISFGKFKQLWSGTQNLKSLKVLGLQYCYKLTDIPDLSLAKNLEELDLTGCHSLRKISSSVQYLQNLTHLSLEDCKTLKKIPPFITDLKKLISPNYKGCISLVEMPLSIQHLNSTSQLNISTL